MDEFDTPEPANAPVSPESKLVAACRRKEWNVAEEIPQNEIFRPRHSDAEDFPVVFPFLQRLDDDAWERVLDFILNHYPGILLAKDRNGRTALSHAAGRGEIRSVQRLLETKQIPRKDMVEALVWVGGRCRSLDSKVAGKVIQLLIANGVDVSRKHEGVIPLTHAVKLESVYVVDWFCRNSSTLAPEAFTSQDDQGRSPLSIAVLDKHDWAIVPLLNTGYYDSYDDSHGRTPLYWLLQSEREETQKRKLAEILIWKEAHDNNMGVHSRLESFEIESLGVQPRSTLHMDPDILNQYHQNDGLNLLSRAVRSNEGEVIRTILKIPGIQVDALNKDSTTPLQVALIENKTDAANALMDADISTFKKLINEGAMDLLEQLLELGYDVNREVDKGRPLLHYVLENTNENAAEKLLGIILNPERGKRLEDVNQPDGRQRTALQLAEGKLQPMRLLLSYGADLERSTMQKHDWFLMYCLHTPSRNHALRWESATSALLLKRWGDGGIEVEFGDLSEMKIFPCCPGSSSFNSEASILVLKDKRALEYQPLGASVCCGRPWRNYHIFSEFPVGDGAKEEFLGIDWITEITADGEPGCVLYSSTLSRVWLPRNGMDFLGEFLKELFSHWQRVCARVDDSMISHRLEGHSADSSRSALFDKLEKDYVYLAQLRAALSRHVEDVRRVGLKYCNDYKYPATDLDEGIERFHQTTIKQLDQFEQVTTGILQLQFARASINEAATIRRITLVTFVYLPLMFSASLFGMNVNVLENNPDWRWYLLFAGASFLVTFGIYYYPFPGIRLPAMPRNRVPTGPDRYRPGVPRPLYDSVLKRRSRRFGIV